LVVLKRNNIISGKGAEKNAEKAPAGGRKRQMERGAEQPQRDALGARERG